MHNKIYVAIISEDNISNLDSGICNSLKKFSLLIFGTGLGEGLKLSLTRLPKFGFKCWRFCN